MRAKFKLIRSNKWKTQSRYRLSIDWSNEDVIDFFFVEKEFERGDWYVERRQEPIGDAVQAVQSPIGRYS